MTLRIPDPRRLPAGLFFPVAGALAGLLVSFTSCAGPGSGTAVGMNPDDIVAGMKRDQIDWMLGPPRSTQAIGSTGGTVRSYRAFYKIRGRAWQCDFENDVVVSHGPAV